MKRNITLPSPEKLLVEARGAVQRDVPLNLWDYAQVIGELRDKKNYSYGKIAAWFTKQLGRAVNKGAIFRVYEDWSEEEARHLEEQIERNLCNPETEPPDAREWVNDLQLLANCAREAATDLCARKGWEKGLVLGALEIAAVDAKRERADELAADEADAAQVSKSKKKSKP